MKSHNISSTTVKHAKVRTVPATKVNDPITDEHDSAAIALMMVWRRIKKLAKTHTALFLGLLTTAFTVMTGLAAAITYMLNLFVFCVDFGYYSLRFNVPVELLTQPQAANLSVNAVLGIILLLVLSAMNSLEIWAYRNCRSTRLLLSVNSMVYILLMLPITKLLAADFSWLSLITVIVVMIPISTIITLMLNIVLISTYIAPTTQDKLFRNQTMLAKWEQKQNKSKRAVNKIAQLKKNIQVLKGNDEKESHSDSKMSCIPLAAACCIVLVVIMFALCILSGIYLVKPNELTTVAGQEEIVREFTNVLPEKYEVNTLAVLYRGDDFILVAPCMANDSTVVVYSRFQRIISAKNAILIYKTNQSVDIQ